MSDRGSVARQVGLGVVVFIATLVLLAGAAALLTRGSAPRASGQPSLAPSTVAASAATSPRPSGPAGSAAAPSDGASGDPAAPVVLTGAGDIADCSRPGAAQTADLLLRETGSFFTLGDNAYPDGRASDFAACYEPTWGRVKDRTILPAPGNHDWNTDGAAGYLAYFGASAGPDGTTWYSRDVGAWHVIVLDSNCARVGGCDADSEQGRWLARDLDASTARCTLALWHHPRFSSGEHGNDPIVDPLWRQLHAAGVDLVVNGHDHDYERFAPMDGAGNLQRPGGMREIVAGTGGAVLRPFHTLAANSEFRLAGSWGVLRLTLHPVNYDWEFVPVGGAAADGGSTPCH
ncbi:MAG TPA: metallophosphoesterase [Candidatus Limnocylindrales bacterium]|nr:metallophosphoesterase [Candidatus Limnocylindrales bacterium]